MRSTFLLMSLLALAAGIASAQIISPVTFTMDRSFEVGNSTFPAGNYGVSPTDDPSFLELRPTDGSHAVLFEVVAIDSVTPFKQTELVFNQYGSNLVLKSIKVEDEVTGATTLTSHLERRHAKSSGKPVRASRPARKKK